MDKMTTTEDFNLESLRLKQDFNETLGVQKVLTHVPVRKPNRTTFIRVNPDDEYRSVFGIVELKEQGETYLVTQDMMHEPGVFELVQAAEIVTYITRQNTVGLWPLKREQDGRINPWHESARDAARIAEKQWVRVQADMSLGLPFTHIQQLDIMI